MDAVLDEVVGGVGPSPSADYRRYWVALYRRDVAAAGRIVEQCLRRWPGGQAKRLYTRLFEPALNLSGAMWADGRITYHDEHFVTWQTARFLRLARREMVPHPPTGPLALAMGVGQESHLLGLRMVCDFLARENWRAEWLTSNDRATVRDAVARTNPAAVLMSIGREPGIESARRLIADLRRRRYRGLVVIGGGPVNLDPSLVGKLGADLTAPNGPHLVRRFREMRLMRPGGQG